MGGGVGAEEHAEGFGELGLPTAFSGKGESATRDSWQSPEVLTRLKACQKCLQFKQRRGSICLTKWGNICYR